MLESHYLSTVATDDAWLVLLQHHLFADAECIIVIPPLLSEFSESLLCMIVSTDE